MKFSNNFNMVQNSYYEIIRDNDLIIKETWYKAPDKLEKIREAEYTYNGDLVSQIVTKQYNEFGTLVQTYTQTLVYDQDELISITGVLE